VFRQGFQWVLDLNCNGTFDGNSVAQGDIAFGFGGIQGDIPVTGKFVAGSGTRVAVVRKYVPVGGSPIGNNFFWVIDNAAATDRTAADHQPAASGAIAPFAFGGVANDVFVSGDWLGSGAARAGIYRGGLWVLDEGVNGATQHTADATFPFGGITGDQPLVGAWSN
jgi:hypothetical protein